MSEFDIYTLGSGYYLEKIFNAIRLITDGKENFVSILKFSCISAIVILAIRAGINNDLKSAAKWFLSVTILVGLFLTSRATIHIHDKLPDSYGILQAPRTVQNVPWGLAVIGSTTSQIGNFLAEKFDMALSGVFVNSTYQETGMLFGSKLIEDVSKMRIQDSNLKSFIAQFYKRCIVPDLRLGYSRTNGYSIKDLAETDDMLGFLKDHSSKARIINYDKDYISCNKAAHNISDALNKEIESRKPKLANSFLSYFFPVSKGFDSNAVFESMLNSSYGIFLRNSSKEAKDILLQNVMINAIGDKAGSYSKAFGKVTTEETTKSAYYSIAGMAQKFVPIYRAVLECILYGIFPLILILMVTPIGLEVLKNYGFGFIYLQTWQPMYAILFSIAGAWGQYYASGIGDSITFANHSRIANINAEISAISGYMLASIPVLSIFITKGMVSSMGNLASSVFYVQQSASVQNAESAIRGNYQIGTTQVDTHSFNTQSGNKFDDNYSWASGMKSFSMQSGAIEKKFADGRSGIDSSAAISNLAGLARVDWSKAIGSRYDQSISDQISQAERHSVNSLESATSGYSKLLGFDKNFSESSQEYKNWNKSLSADQRESIDEAKSYVKKFAENHNLSQQDALKLSIAGNSGIGIAGKFGRLGINLNADGTASSTKGENFQKLVESSKDNRFAESLSKVESLATSTSVQGGSHINSNLLQGARNDLNFSKSSSIQTAHALDTVHNLQESKAKFEQNSSNISQDLSNIFAETGITKYGAVGFEKMIRENPQKTNELLNQFLDSNLPQKASNIESEYENQKKNLSSDYLDKIHQQNIKNTATDFETNKENMLNTIPQNFENKITSKLQNAEEDKDSVIENIASIHHQSDNKKDGLELQNSEIEDKVTLKNNKTASGAMIDKFNPFKDK